MIDYSSISETLKLIKTLYDKEGSTLVESTLYSKMAVMELCGWIEVSFDKIWLSYIDKNVSSETVIRTIKEKIKKTYSFAYEANLSPIFCMLMGGKAVEELEACVGDIDMKVLRDELDSLKKKRDKFAHVHTDGTQQSFSSPSDVWFIFNRIKPIIEKIENKLCLESEK